MIDLLDWPNDRTRTPAPGELTLLDWRHRAGLVVVRGRFRSGHYFVTVYTVEGRREREHSCHSTAREERSHELFDGYSRSLDRAA